MSKNTNRLEQMQYRAFHLLNSMPDSVLETVLLDATDVFDFDEKELEKRLPLLEFFHAHCSINMTSDTDSESRPGDDIWIPDSSDNESSMNSAWEGDIEDDTYSLHDLGLDDDDTDSDLDDIFGGDIEKDLERLLRHDDPVSLVNLGRNLTDCELAKNFPKIHGRERQLRMFDAYLLLPQKAIAITGKSGSGKTALVQAKARELCELDKKRADIPARLRDVHLIEIKLSDIIAKAEDMREINARFNEICDRFEESWEPDYEGELKKAVMVIDEAHELVAFQTLHQDDYLIGNDLVTELLRRLTNGKLKAVFITTSNQYMRTFTRAAGGALARRLMPLHVPPLSEEEIKIDV